MPSAFETAHADEIAGTLTTVDRMIVHGHLRRFYFGGGMGLLLGLLKVRLGDFGRFAFDVSERLKRHAQQWAQSSGRPFIYQDRVVRGKDDLARKIARRDGVRDGLVCVFSTLELASCFAFRGGQVVRSLRKCLHLYFYLIDREFGLIHLRLQTWFPFQVQIYINGREWLARQLDKRGVRYRRYENTFLQIDDMALAQRLCRRFAQRAWIRIFDAFARRINPALPLLLPHGFGSYYWSLDACEIATDVMWKSRSGLLRILGDLFDYALRCLSAQDVMRFLGAKVLRGDTRFQTSFKPQLPHGDATLAARRPEGRRLKHRIRRNWIKLYDKWSVLRVETVINNPRDFRVLRFQPNSRGRRIGRWIPMRKGICNLPRYLEVGEAANRRYLDALAEVRPTAHTIVQLDALTRARRLDGRRYARFNPVSAGDAQLFEAVLRGEHTIGGLRNRDLEANLYHTPASSPDDAKRRCARISRLIAKLRGHGLLAKVSRSRLYRVTGKGRRVMSAALRFRKLDFVAWPSQTLSGASSCYPALALLAYLTHAQIDATGESTLTSWPETVDQGRET